MGQEVTNTMGAFGIDIPKETICILDAGLTKYDALDKMVQAIASTGVVDDVDAFRDALYERETIRSTGFRGVAIPHVRIDEINHPTVGVGVARDGIDFESLDNDPVNIVVLFAMPSGSDKEYLGYLAQVMMALRADGFCEELMDCDTPEAVLEILSRD